MALLLRVVGAGLCTAVLSAQGAVNSSLIQPRVPDAARQQLRATGPGALAAAAAPAVVHVAVEVTGRNVFQIERPGSGVIVDASGLVLTWLALVQEAVDARDKRVVVQLGDAARTVLAATVAASDAGTGLCLLRVGPPPGAPLPFLELADAAALAEGEPALVLALSDGKDRVVFAGAAGRSPIAIRCAGKEHPPAALVLTDARIDRRCHGAALVDASGRLLGLCSAEHVHRDVSEPTLEDLKASSFGFALGADAVRSAFAAQFAAAKVANVTLLKPPAADAARDRARLEGAAAAVARCRLAIVAVWDGEDSEKSPPPPKPDDPYAVQRREHVGSGVIVAAEGLVLTNRHLVYGVQHVRVALQDGRTFPAEIVTGNAPANVALLKLTLPEGTALPAIDCGSEGEAILGETLVALGNPTGKALSVSAGVLSAKRRGGRLQADPNLGNQNGGGALVDVEGRLVAIVDGGVVDHLDLAFAESGQETKTESNLSTAIGIDAIRQLFAAEVKLPVAPGHAEGRQTALTRAVATCAGAMLNVYVSQAVAPDDDANPFSSLKPSVQMVHGLGSGVIIDRSGLALTNWHVVQMATEPDGSMRRDTGVQVRTFEGGPALRAHVLSISREDDLALLQLELAEGRQVAAVELGDSDALQPGEQVLAIGNPHGFANTITAGVVAAVNQDIQVKHRWDKLRNLIETDAAINAGNSGGALVDLGGALVGINSAGSHGFSLQGYAIPVNHVRKQVLELLLSPYKLRSPDLGVKVSDRDGHVTVVATDPEGPGQRAGIAAGDVLVALDGHQTDWSGAFAMALLRADPARDLDLTIARAGKEQQVKVHPLSATAAAVQRQTGLELETFAFRDAPELVRAACTGMHRKFTGDATGEPASIPDSLVRIVRVHPLHQGKDTDVQPGDLLLAVESASGGTEGLRRFHELAEVQRCFNDPALGSYEGAHFRAWLWRDGAVRVTELTCKRLLW